MRDFNHTVNVLVKAFFEGTLLHTDCCACVVGNIVASSNGVKITLRKGDLTEMSAEWENGEDTYWFDPFNCGGGYDSRMAKEIRVVNQIAKTGYTFDELHRIKRSFEGCERPFEGRLRNDDPTWMFNGLMAVVDVLADIHNIDLTAKEEAKKLFVKA